MDSRWDVGENEAKLRGEFLDRVPQFGVVGSDVVVLLAELVDRHRIACRPVRALLIRHLDQRRRYVQKLTNTGAAPLLGPSLGSLPPPPGAP